MGKPFTFHFSRADDGSLRAMTMLDLQATCGLCGYEEMQRFYRGVFFHNLNIPRFLRLIREAPRLLKYSCSNCGEPVVPGMVHRGALTYGFVGGDGVIHAFFKVDEREGIDPIFLLRERRRLDPQALPTWDADDADERDRTFELDEDMVFEALGRTMHPKGVWRSLWEEFFEDPAAQCEHVAPGCWLYLGNDEESLDDFEEDFPEDFEGLVRFAVQEEPEGDRWFQGKMHGRYAQWLPPNASGALAQNGCVALALLDPEVALREIEWALERARLEFVREGEEAQVRITNITTPRGVCWEGEIVLEDVLKFAATTAVTPSEAGRFVAEEVIAELLGLSL